ncbi:MAG: response regulator transcription factor [Prevotella sp.]|nr:response regulator transcription factor [Prevotella sp.]
MVDNRLVRAYIVDDDITASALLRKLLEDYSVELLGMATDANDRTLDDIVELEPDLLFLDVEMPSMSGLEFSRKLRPLVKPDMKVVFYSGYDKYLLEALRQQAFDYMLKPASRQELAKIMTRYYENKLSNIQQAMPRAEVTELPQVMVVNATNEHTVLNFSEIAYFRFDSERRIWEVVTSEGRKHQLRHRTTADIILAYSSLFVQIHKGYIVNVRHISKVSDSQCFLRPPLDHVNELHVSKNYRHNLMATFYNI